jgi:hypothetical protein
MNADDLATSFPSTIKLPEAFRALCDWVTANGYPISGFFELRKHDDETLRCWFGTDAAVGHLAQFGAGADGSLYCLWRSPDGQFPIVHMGSEGDHNLVLAPTPVDFLRLLAMGYGELGFADFDSPPSEEEEPDNINKDFQRWVTSTFDTTIPRVGASIVLPTDRKHRDFQEWINARCG